MDSYALKLSGKAELPEAIEISNNFRLALEGAVVSETKADNDDGTHTHTYLFKPVTVVTIDKTGKTLKAKDTRSRGQQLRSVIVREWEMLNEPIEKEAYYDQEMLKIIQTRLKKYD